MGAQICGGQYFSVQGEQPVQIKDTGGVSNTKRGITHQSTFDQSINAMSLFVSLCDHLCLCHYYPIMPLDIQERQAGAEPLVTMSQK